MTVSFGTSNTFLNLVKDLNKGELVPQVAQHGAILPVLSGKYTSFTGSRSVNIDRTHCALSHQMEQEVVTDHPPVHRKTHATVGSGETLRSHFFLSSEYLNSPGKTKALIVV